MKYPDDFAPFIDRMIYLATGLRADFTADRFDFYFEMLQDIPFENVAAAIQTAGRLCEFFPTPSKLREFASETMSASDAAERAWERFRYALQHVTVYETVDFGDPVLHAVIRSLFGGWPQTIEIQSNKLSFVRSDFLKSYGVFAKTGGLVPEPLLGLMPGPQPMVVPSLAMRASLNAPRMLERGRDA